MSKTKRNSDPYDHELWWFWNEADGDMGLRASPLEPSYGGQVDTLDDNRCKAAARHRDIGLVLGALDPDQVDLLRLAHTPIPPALRPQLGKLGPLAHVVFDAAPSADWVLERLKRNGTDDELARALERARLRVAKAISLFRAERDRWKALSKRKAS